jgi:hypothetical protein
MGMVPRCGFPAFTDSFSHQSMRRNWPNSARYSTCTASSTSTTFGSSATTAGAAGAKTSFFWAGKRRTRGNSSCSCIRSSIGSFRNGLGAATFILGRVSKNFRAPVQERGRWGLVAGRGAWQGSNRVPIQGDARFSFDVAPRGARWRPLFRAGGQGHGGQGHDDAQEGPLRGRSSPGGGNIAAFHRFSFPQTHAARFSRATTSSVGK